MISNGFNRKLAVFYTWYTKFKCEVKNRFGIVLLHGSRRAYGLLHSPVSCLFIRSSPVRLSNPELCRSQLGVRLKHFAVVARSYVLDHSLTYTLAHAVGLVLFLTAAQAHPWPRHETSPVHQSANKKINMPWIRTAPRELAVFLAILPTTAQTHPSSHRSAKITKFPNPAINFADWALRSCGVTKKS